MSASLINLVVALPAEAKPIASRLGLERVHTQRIFPIYRRGHARLAVCAPGKINAAAATAYLGALSGGRRDAIWVNIGAAGHAHRHVGEVVLAHRITDTGSGRIWHPSLPPGEPFPSESLLTLDRPDLSYEQDSMVDMEASGFYATASRFSRVELVQVLKVISDNRKHPAHGLSAKQVRGLMLDALAPLEALIALLAKTATGLQEPEA